MTEKELVTMIMESPEFKVVYEGAKLEPRQAEKAVETRYPVVLAQVSNEYPWKWAIGIDDELTVANQSDYTLEGAGGKDCEDIINIRFATSSTPTSFKVLGEMSSVEMDHYDEDHAMSSPEKWILLRYDKDRFPVFRLFDSPASTGDTLRYRYRRRNVGITAFPPPFDEVFRLAMMAQFMPSYVRRYVAEIAKMVKRHDPELGSEDMARLGKHLEARNRSRNGKYGYN